MNRQSPVREATAENARVLEVLVIGGGKMGAAIVEGWLGAGEAGVSGRRFAITVIEPGEQRRAELAGRGAPWDGVALVADASEVKRIPDLVLIAVKPQVMASVLKSLRAVDAVCGEGVHPLFVSIAAGVATSTIEAELPEHVRVVRVMPNMPLAIGCGASGVCGGAESDADDVELVEGLFAGLGRAVVVDEADMDAVCAVSGSGPAYVAAFVEALRDAGVANGLAPATAEALALQTLLGTARLLDEGSQPIAEVRESICSPGGTTIAALDAMREAGFAGVIRKGVDAAVKRSKELAQCS